MRGTILQRWLALAVLSTAAALLGPVTAAEEKAEGGFKPLFNGKDLSGWKFELPAKADPAKTWSVEDKVIICTGRPNGYFYTDKTYGNYVLRYDWRYKRPKNLVDDKKFGGNSGALVHIQPPQKVWPKCVEVQGMNRDHGALLFLGVKGQGKFDREAHDKATKPVGEWNTTEIICGADGTITAKINGTQVSTGKSTLTEGYIGFQSEGAEIHFRNILLKQMK